MEGGRDSVDSRVWADNFARFGPQVIGRTMFDYGYPNWGENSFPNSPGRLMNPLDSRHSVPES
jgi:hypothetical protein